MDSFLPKQIREGDSCAHSVCKCRAGLTTCFLLFLSALVMLAAAGCGGSARSSSSNNNTNSPIAANWQFNLAPPSDNSFQGSTDPSCVPATTSDPAPLCIGGFLQENSGAVNGQVVYSIVPASQSSSATPCSGSASVSGGIQGQTVNLTMQAGPQTLSLSGTLSGDGKTMMGTYSSVDTHGCGTAQSGLQWKAFAVPSLSGAVQGNFHSSATNHLANPDFPANQDFTISGVLTQSPNIGASNATITGTLSFDGYPCLGKAASVNGQISGSSVILQIIASNGLNVGQIGATLSSLETHPSPVVFQSTPGAWLLTGKNGYGVSTKQCPGGNVPGDFGNVCLAMGESTSCTQPLLLTPASLTFPPQLLNSPPTAQLITITNNDPAGATLDNLTLQFQPQSGLQSHFTQDASNVLSDFSGLPNFTMRDFCATSPGAPFSLRAGQSCSVRVFFSPQESCPWFPAADAGDPPSQHGAAPSACPIPLTAALTVTSPKDAFSDDDPKFTVAINGTGMSSIVPSTFELDFGSEANPEVSVPQTLTFTNQSTAPVQILPALTQPCQNGPAKPFLTLPRPAVAGALPGLQVIATGNGTTFQDVPMGGGNAFNSINYNCDSDLTSGQPNFKIKTDGCSGMTLTSQASCNIQIAFAPQPATSTVSGLDYFLQLNTLQCTGTNTSDCEVDSGRLPVELKANPTSPLRMAPSAGLDFLFQTVGETSAARTITLSNDPYPNPVTVNFTGNVVKGNFLETDNCGSGLAPGGHCTVTVTFTPLAIGLNQGSVTIGYAVNGSFGQTQTIFLRGTGQ